MVQERLLVPEEYTTEMVSATTTMLADVQMTMMSRDDVGERVWLLKVAVEKYFDGTWWKSKEGGPPLADLLEASSDLLRRMWYVLERDA